MRAVVYLLLAALLVSVEAVLPRLAGLDLARPLLVVPFVLHLAMVAETVEGAALACAAGFLLDATGGRPTGLSASAMVAVFVAARVLLLGLAAGGRVVELGFTAILVALFHGYTWGLAQALGPPMVPTAETPWAMGTLWSVLATLLASPFVRWACQRIERAWPRETGTLA